ncbi:MAG TPA: Tim44-like domain-containing protein [Burkholderiales bacterium]|nr:Tim44-like domain-containing protein [Burkholderiales bacterium]
MSRLAGILIALFAFSIAFDADAARRMGGGKNIGKQREMINPNQAAPRTPPQQQQQQAAPAKQAQPGAAPAPQPSGMSKWLGPLAGLAIGAGLAALFMNNGLAGALAGILLLAALAFGAVLLFKLLFGAKRGTQSPLRYAGATPAGSAEPREPVLAPPSQPIGGIAAPHSVAATTADAAPAQDEPEFDREQFLQHARTNFINLQGAHDRRDLRSIRDFLTPELYRDIEADVRASGTAPQKTDIVTLNAEVADVTTEGGLYVVSVRFSGLIREEPGAEAQPFSEVWHLEKPTNGRSGWLVSGIQQV